MFERNKIDTLEHSGVPVEITMATDEVLSGRVLVTQGRNLADVLNSAGGFIEFEPYGGERMFIAKGSLRAIKPKHVPKVPSLKGRLGVMDGFDPHAVLGVPSEAPFDAVKAAWHRLAMVYHPDRYASVELPAEVGEYLDAMARRINAAYGTLQTTMQPPHKAAGHRSEPIYTSRARA